MLMGIFVVFQVIVILLFVGSFFLKKNIFWVLTVVLSGILMFSAWGVETYSFQYNSTIELMQPTITATSYPYLAGINMIFFAAGIIYFLFGIFEKYGDLFKKKNRE